ncbi:MAG: FxsA family protein [Pseudomonadota bacterium]
MLRILPFLLFLSVPLIEIALFIQIGGLLGLIPTIVIVIGTALLGTMLLRRQGLGVVERLRSRMANDEVPVEELTDGVFLFVAALLLLTPGFLTDTAGFLLFVPNVRRALARSIKGWFMENGTVHVRGSMGGRARNRPGGPDTQAGPQMGSQPNPDGARTRTSGPSGWRRPPDVIDGEAEDITPPDRP